MLKGLAIVMVVAAGVCAMLGQIGSALMFTAVAALNFASLWLKAQRAPREQRFWADTGRDEPHRLYLTHRPIGAYGAGRPGWRLQVAGPGSQAVPDVWEPSLALILPHTLLFTDRPLDWRSEATGEPAELVEPEDA